MSFNIALSGIQAINEQLETVSHNISNAGTTGFKASRANFASLVADGVANGVEVGSVTQNIGLSGGVVSTGRSLDAMISGRGFFAVRDPQGQLNFTRVGIFSPDKDGFLVDPAGRKVQGYGKGVGGALGVMGDISVPTGQIPAVQSTRSKYVGNLSSDWTAPAAAFDYTNAATYNMVKQTVVYDALGDQHTVSQFFRKTAANTVEVHYGVDGAAPTATQTLAFTGGPGQLPAPAPTGTVTIPAGDAPTFDVIFEYTGTTQYAGDALTTTNAADGYASGAFVGVELGEDGSVIAKYSNEQQQVVGTLAIATFPDEGALTQISDTSWAVNERSGNPLFERPGVGVAGRLNTGAVEGSNVDVTSELVGLMTAQRNYQANSKVITTQNQMMQSLMQSM